MSLLEINNLNISFDTNDGVVKAVNDVSFNLDKNESLAIVGDSGSGKTHLAVAIASAMEQDGKKIFFAFVPELMDYLRSAFSPSNSMNSGKIFDEVKRSSMLILDDLGVERDSEWSQERLYQIIVHRQNYRLPTVITTRTDFTIEARRGSAPASRIQDASSGQGLKIDAPDYRLSV